MKNVKATTYITRGDRARLSLRTLFWFFKRPTDFFYKSKACETSLSEKTRKYDSTPPFPIRGSINRDFIVYVQTTSPLSPTAEETGVSHFYTALLYICASYLSRRPNAVGVFFFFSHHLDIDECKIGSHNCGENSTCVNAFGSYACFCNVGFTESYSLEGKLQCVGVSLMPFCM